MCLGIELYRDRMACTSTVTMQFQEDAIERAEQGSSRNFFLYEGRSEQYHQHAIVQYPPETLSFLRTQIKSRVTGLNISEMKRPLFKVLHWHPDDTPYHHSR